MTVAIRWGGNEWMVVVKGEPIGSADNLAEAQALADYWEARLRCIARWRRLLPDEKRDFPHRSQRYS